MKVKIVFKKGNPLFKKEMILEDVSEVDKIKDKVIVKTNMYSIIGHAEGFTAGMTFANEWIKELKILKEDITAAPWWGNQELAYSAPEEAIKRVFKKQEEANMKYKVGDKVRIKTWKEMEKEYGGVDSQGDMVLTGGTFVINMKKYCGKIMTILRVRYDGKYRMKEDNGDWGWTDKMIKGLATKRAIFYCKRVMENGEKYIQINGWENVLRKDKLPVGYYNEYPYFYLDSPSNGLYVAGGDYFGKRFYKKGAWMTLSEFEQLFDEDTGILQIAGERLSKILKEKRWQGSFEVKI